MSESADLDRLCELHGIAVAYDDIWGARREASDATKRALLGSMGVDVADPRAAIDACLAAPWARCLPPVHVVREDEAPIAVPVSLPEADRHRVYRWHLEEDNGREHAAEVRPADLAVCERAHIEGTPFVRYRLELAASPALGYHRLRLAPTDAGVAEAATTLIVAPRTAYRPGELAGGERVWGLAAQLYAVRSRRNWGVGDYTDLGRLVGTAADCGAALVGLNPLHSLFPDEPARASPYGPSSRLFLNTLYLDVEAIADFADCAAARDAVGGTVFRERLESLRSAPRVDYAGVAACKREIIELLYASFRSRHLGPDTERGAAFRDFQARGGAALQRHALFEALQEHFRASDPDAWGWPAWPAEFRSPEAPAVAEFAAGHRERIEFFQYLQWEAERQLEAAARHGDERSGLYLDLAVSVDRGGADAWAGQGLYAAGASIGAPPDDFSPQGQAWGLPPMVPERLRELAYEPLAATLRHNMRHARALRIDHVMGLMRLFWVPEGKSATEGAYVHYPFEDLLAVVALESRLNRCVVVGEDLGTVPDEVREAMRRTGLLSYRVFFFERLPDGDLKPPADYPADALATVSTHDLPTLHGFWAGDDLGARHELGLFATEEARQAQILDRAQDRARMLIALDREGLLPEGVAPDPATVPELDHELACAVHRYLARAPARILMVQLEDVLGERAQANLPGTVDEYPNWRRKLPEALDAPPARARLASLARAVARERGAPTPSAAPTRRDERAVAIPRATYRLQLHRQFTFVDAAALVPYLDALGVSHCYASPYLRARPGSTHGYDIIDHSSLDPELGDQTDFARFTAALREHAMGHILDMVPNHMAVMGSDNAWWLDVLENGQASAYAGYFDIDWRPVNEALRGKVLLPVLGDHYGRVLEGGEIALEFVAETGEFRVVYYEHVFPVDPSTYPAILQHRLETLAARLGEGAPELMELQSLVTAFGRLPSRAETAFEAREERARDNEIGKRRLADLCRQSSVVGDFLAENVAAINATVAQETGGNLLHHLLEQQAYRLAFWRVAADDINYRRFFDINDLAGLRMENPAVFEDAHRLIASLVAGGDVAGLRIDHPDGLYDPARYFRDLNRALRRAGGETESAFGDAADESPACYLVVEKILAAHEHLREDWPVHGTTGYDFATLVNGLLVFPDSRESMDALYARFIGREIDFDDLLYERKKLIIRTQLSSELGVLANNLSAIAQLDPRTRDFTLNGLRDALIEIVACFPVYRTYVAEEGASAEDRTYVDWAVAQAKKRSPAADVTIFDFVRGAMLLDLLDGRSASYGEECVRFAMKLQQYTAPVMAKGLEDTAFYVYNRLVSLNDVGGDPRRYGTSVAAFHHANRERLRRWPHAMITTSTHDGKRSEDVRARLDVLSEIPERWRDRIRHWSRVNRRRKREIDEQPAPTPNDEYLLYQTLLGAWPLEELDGAALAEFRDRVERYMLKATREAKSRTSWINPDEAYEQATTEFVRSLLAGTDENPFLADFLPFKREVAHLGLLNGLSQTLLKLTAPGVPDTYQGTEMWDFSLVDPDNRRPVDYERRRAALAELQEWPADGVELARRAHGLLDDIEDGRAKLYLVWRALGLRAERSALFERGEYVPLAVDGGRAEHVCAFARKLDGFTVVAVAPRWFARLPGAGETLPLGDDVWAGTRVEDPDVQSDAPYRNVLTGERIAPDDGRSLDAAALLGNFSVALLVRER